MSKFNLSSSYFKKKTYQLNIKPSKKEIKEQNMIKKNKINNETNISDDDFNQLMNENKINENKINKKNPIKLSDFLNKINNPIDPIVSEKLSKEQNIGNNLVDKIKMMNITGVELLKYILDKYNDPNDYNWIKLEQYGFALEFLLKNNYDEQLLCLLMIQNYSQNYTFPKINYKDKQMYFIKIIFQLFFTYGIIDEQIFWKWQDLLSDFDDIDENTKKLLCIQTAEFFNILKMTFTDDDYNDGLAQTITPNNFNDKLLEKSKEIDTETNIDKNIETNEYDVPEEQDFNLDDI